MIILLMPFIYGIIRLIFGEEIYSSSFQYCESCFLLLLKIVVISLSIVSIILFFIGLIILVAEKENAIYEDVLFSFAIISTLISLFDFLYRDLSKFNKLCFFVSFS